MSNWTNFNIKMSALHVLTDRNQNLSLINLLHSTILLPFYKKIENELMMISYADLMSKELLINHFSGLQVLI